MLMRTHYSIFEWRCFIADSPPVVNCGISKRLEDFLSDLEKSLISIRLIIIPNLKSGYPKLNGRVVEHGPKVKTQAGG